VVDTSEADEQYREADLPHVMTICTCLIIPVKAREYVFTGVGLSVCLCVCL